jgi:excisionase family DNA binding protein
MANPVQGPSFDNRQMLEHSGPAALACKVFVCCNAAFGDFELAEKDVAYARRNLQSFFGIHPQATPLINGELASEATRLKPGDRLEFCMETGKKGAIDGPVYTVKEASVIYFQGKVSVREVYCLFNAGQLRGCRVGRKILIYRSSLDEYTTGTENFSKDRVPAAEPILKESLARSLDTKRRERAEKPGFQVFRLP